MPKRILHLERQRIDRSGEALPRSYSESLRRRMQESRMRENRTYGLTRDRRPKVRPSATGTTHRDGLVGNQKSPSSNGKPCPGGREECKATVGTTHNRLRSTLRPPHPVAPPVAQSDWLGKSLHGAHASQGSARPSWPGAARHPCEEPWMATTRAATDWYCRSERGTTR